MWKKALIAAGLSLLLACGGSGPKPGPESSATPGATSTPTAQKTPTASQTPGANAPNRGQNGSQTSATDETATNKVVLGPIKRKKMNLVADQDRLFQNGPTKAEIARYKARMAKKKSSRLTGNRGGHTLPVFPDEIEQIKEKG